MLSTSYKEIMKAQKTDWYKHGWTLDIKNQSWVEDTENQVDFIIKTLNLTGKERILDLACGYGRHSLSFARKGYSAGFYLASAKNEHCTYFFKLLWKRSITEGITTFSLFPKAINQLYSFQISI